MKTPDNKLPAQKLIFDLDGTLVDTAADLVAAANRIFSDIGLPLMRVTDVGHMVGLGAAAIMKYGLKNHNNNPDIDTLIPAFLAHYETHIAIHSKPYPQMLETVLHLKSLGFEIAICTNKPEYLARKLLTELEIIQYFPIISGGDSLPYKKPDPRHILETASRLTGDGPVVMIGDSVSDIQGAINANISSIGVTYGYSDVPIETLGATKLVDAISEIPKHVAFSVE